MCGILGVSSPPGKVFPIKKCLEALQHRGPDDSGVYVSPTGECHLGHVRLSILDLTSAGRQPMSDSSGRFVISYNGEIYNYQELKRGLDNRYGDISWKSCTDTEVILEGFSRDGVEFLDRLNGIFSLLIYDERERILYVLRDPIGIKPLFFTVQQGSTFFASEMRGFRALSDLRRTLRSEYFSEQLAFMYVPEPYTPFREYMKISPGICFSYREGVLISSKTLFTRLGTGVGIRSEDEATEALQKELSDAVKRQLISDVPVSLLLSGGLDSTAVAFEAVHQGAKVSDAYTIAFSDDDLKKDAQSDDLRYARIAADNLGLELKVITANTDFISILPELVCHMEDGFSDPAAINTYLICEEAKKEGIKVLLSGQGADEYLGGYRRYLAEQSIRRIPKPVRKVLSQIDKILPASVPGMFNAVNRRMKRLSALAGQPLPIRILNMYSWSNRETICNLLIEPGSCQYETEFYDKFASFSDIDIIDAMMKLDQHYDLMSLNLCYTDRMSMAAGIECRVPFLDFELVRLMNSIPANFKIRGQQGKYIFKKAMEPILPKQIIYRQKAGFGLPIRAWMNSRNSLLLHYLDSPRIKRQGIFNPDSVAKLLKEQHSGQKDHSHCIFTLLVQQLWLESNSII